MSLFLSNVVSVYHARLLNLLDLVTIDEDATWTSSMYETSSAAANYRQRNNASDQPQASSSNSVGSMIIEFESVGEKRSREEEDNSEEENNDDSTSASITSLLPSPKKPKSLLGEEESNLLDNHQPLMIGCGDEVWGKTDDVDETIDAPPADGLDDDSI